MPPSEASASSTSSSKPIAVGRISSAPASIRVMSSRLVTSLARRSDCSSMSSRSSARSSGPKWTPTWRRLDTAVLMEASGVRRSCEAAPISALRQRSISSSRRVAQRLLAQLGPVDGKRRLVGERAEEAPFSLTQLHVLQYQHAHRPVAHHQGHRHPARSGVVHKSQGSGLTAPRSQGDHVPLRQRLAGRGRNLQLLGGSRLPGVCGENECGPTRREDALHGGNDVGQQLRQGQVADESLRQFEEA